MSESEDNGSYLKGVLASELNSSIARRAESSKVIDVSCWRSDILGITSGNISSCHTVSHILAEQQDNWSTGHKQSSYPTKRFDAEKDVKFYLYTQSNPTSATSLSVGDVSTLANFNPDLSTKIIVHGWLAGPKDMDDSREAYLATGQDLNVVMVDWTAGANNILYNLAKDDVVSVGERIAALLDFLSEQGLDQNKVHITGHSLGAHIAGVAGNRLAAGKVARITGLDPAAPLYGQESLENRLDPTDASFVEVVHTCAGLLGWADPMGHVDFYPNSGEPVQPGCGTDLAELGLAESRPSFLSPPRSVSTILSPPHPVSTILSPPHPVSTILSLPSSFRIDHPFSPHLTQYRPSFLSPPPSVSTILSLPSSLSIDHSFSPLLAQYRPSFLSPPPSVSTILSLPTSLSIDHPFSPLLTQYRPSFLSPPHSVSTILSLPSSRRSCSHIRARALFAESITTNVGFVGVLCSDWKTYENDGCSHNPTALMGDPTNTSAKEGSYYLTTASSSPFAQG
uniref:Lipase domain-containing protein n=1 Tax=Timema poppense TaxID=170557 RepID=A0A7R9DAA4_TIMPO|nr:unnamed protein product [Timema poppensis]